MGDRIEEGTREHAGHYFIEFVLAFAATTTLLQLLELSSGKGTLVGFFGLAVEASVSQVPDRHAAGRRKNNRERIEKDPQRMEKDLHSE